MAGIVTAEQANEIIDALERKHRLFKAISVQPHAAGFFVTFEEISLSPTTIYKWFEEAGVIPRRIGTEGTGDNAVMYAEVKI